VINQICYVLSSTGTDLYAQMTCISASLSRRLYPDAKIVLLVDEVTNLNLARCQSPLLALANQTICLQTDLESAGARSRFVKTSMRQVVDSDFVFIDADALPIRKFDEIDSPGAAMAAALDLDEFSGRPRFPPFAVERLRACGWSAPLPQYFNSGVIFMADTPEMRAFGQEWHRRWQRIFAATGDYRDQPSFNSAIDAMGVKVHVLPDAFNATVYISPWKARHARILHYWMNYADGRAPENSLLAHLLNSWRATSQIDWEAVERTKKQPLSFNSWREILMPLLGPRGRIPRKWLWNLSKLSNHR
jgi:hypothetical protein